MVTRYLAGLLLCVMPVLSVQSQSTNNVPEEAGLNTRAWLNYWQDSDLHVAGFSDASAMERQEYGVASHWTGEALELSASYQHRTFLIRQGDPAHNGYLHQLDASMQQQWGAWQVTGTLGIHGTSNRFRHRDWHPSMWVGSMQILYLPDQHPFYYGVSGDYKFGHFQLYPRLGKQWRLRNGSELVVDLPIGFHWRHPENNWLFSIERHGEKWSALDETRQLNSAIYWREWRAQLQWQSDQHWGLQLGYSFDSHIDYRDHSLGQRREELSNAWYLGFTLNSQ